MDVFKAKYDETISRVRIINVLTGVTLEDNFNNWDEAQGVVNEMNHNLRMGILE